VCAALHPAHTSAAPTEAQINEAVRKGVEFLRNNMRHHNGGMLALMVMALVKAGVPADAPDVAAALESLAANARDDRYVPLSYHRYEAGVTIMALSSASPDRYHRQIGTISRYLLDAQLDDGQWYYPEGSAGALSIPRNAGDTSITQYALLGLWEADRAGVKVPKSAWDRAAAWHIRWQLRDGGFTYHPTGYGASDTNPTHSMTAAGTASLLVARLHLYPDAKDLPLEEVDESTGEKKAKKKPTRKFGILEPAEIAEPSAEPGPAADRREPSDYKPTTRLVSINNAVARGMRWLARNFTVDVPRFAPTGGWAVYYLYGLERLAALSGVTEIGGHDWYAEGAEFLLKAQQPEGYWRFADSAREEGNTSFAILFLVRATEKTLQKGRPRRRDPRFGGGLLVGGRGLPQDLNEIALEKGVVKPRKLKGAVDELLAQLEKADDFGVQAVQQTLVETILMESAEALIGQKGRLLMLLGDGRPEVRRTACWALGRTNDLSVVPRLIERLRDEDAGVMIEARNAIRYIAKQPTFLDLPDEATDAQKQAAAAQCRRWYLSVRPYAERDDLAEGSP
jgi:hypothetical protein